jgi:SAM-dependent methyltransferase
MSLIKNYIKSIPFFLSIKKNINNQLNRDSFIRAELEKIQAGKLLLDAGCGNQPYREFCSHLDYKAQDFGQYSTDLKKTLKGSYVEEKYKYGHLDYVGDIWDIKEQSNTFDVILCSEVFEHIPHPIETIKEFSRLLKKNGKLILTAPSNSLRHMDPYFFYSGFSDRWFEKFLGENDFKIESIDPVGDYYRWLMVEMFRTAISHSIYAKLVLAPAFLYFYNKNKSAVSVNTLCMGYQIVAIKI